LFVYGNHLWENRTITGIFNNDVPYGNLWEIDCFFWWTFMGHQLFFEWKTIGNTLGTSLKALNILGSAGKLLDMMENNTSHSMGI
jgi:hypothetical protein